MATAGADTHCAACTCDCGWAQKPGACSKSDGCCCWACCCHGPSPAPPAPAPPAPAPAADLSCPGNAQDRHNEAAP